MGGEGENCLKISTFELFTFKSELNWILEATRKKIISLKTNKKR